MFYLGNSQGSQQYDKNLHFVYIRMLDSHFRIEFRQLLFILE